MSTIFACIILLVACILFSLIIDYFVAYLRDSRIVRKYKKAGIVKGNFNYKDYRKVKEFEFANALSLLIEEKEKANNVKDRVLEKDGK